MQATLCQASAGKSHYLSFSETGHHLKQTLGTSNQSKCYSSINLKNNACTNAITSLSLIQSGENYNTSCVSGTCLITCMSFRTPLHSLNRTKFIKPSLSDSYSIRHYAKGKDRESKGGKGKSKIDISDEEMHPVVNSERLMFEFNELIDNFKEELTKGVAIRTNVGNLEGLPIELEGDTYPLNELAQVHRKSPTLVVINCSAFPQASKSVVTAIINSGMNLNPQQEGTSIAVPIPKVTREHREGLATKAKQLCNKCKDNLRQVHNNYVRKAKGKEGQVSADTLHKVTLKVKELLDESVKEAETLLAAKQSELLKSS